MDSYCCALWDEGWFRGRIVSVSRSECEVFFVDYGNTDVVENSNIRVSVVLVYNDKLIRC